MHCPSIRSLKINGVFDWQNYSKIAISCNYDRYTQYLLEQELGSSEPPHLLILRKLKVH